MKAIVRICATPRRTEALWRNDGEICSATLWSASVNVDIEYDIQRSHCAHTRISQRPNTPRFHFSLVETLSLIRCLGRTARLQSDFQRFLMGTSPRSTAGVDVPCSLFFICTMTGVDCVILKSFEQSEASARKGGVSYPTICWRISKVG